MAKPRIKRTAGKAVDASKFSLDDVFRASKNLGMSVMRGAWGRSLGKLLVRSAAPWKGVTIGLETTAEKIAAIDAVNPIVAARNKEFATMMNKLGGTKGVMVARTADGSVSIVPRIAYEASLKGKTPMKEIQSVDTLVAAERYIVQHGLEAQLVSVLA